MMSETERRNLPTVGRALAERRHERGLDLADIARETRIPLRHLAALEEDRHGQLPALAYSTGFVRTYAGLLGLNADQLVRQFRGETTQLESTSPLAEEELAAESRIPSRSLILTSLAALALLIAGIIYFASRESAPAEGAAVPEQAMAEVDPPVLSESAAPPVADTVKPPEPPVSDPLAAASPQTVSPGTMAAGTPAALPALPGAAGPVVAGVPPVGLVLRANEDSWIKVSDGGPVSLKIGILKAGETYSVPQMPGIKLTTGNAGGVDVIFNGKQLPAIGAKGMVAKNVPLDPASLSAPRAP
jgi:cytoskeleton protein RodZ